jgi:hypothetical protein
MSVVFEKINIYKSAIEAKKLSENHHLSVLQRFVSTRTMATALAGPQEKIIFTFPVE